MNEQAIPGRNPCATALEQLNEYLDCALSPEEETAVRRHLEVCRCCAAHFQFDRRLLALIREKCQTGPAPEQLRAEVLRLLAEL